MELFLDTETTGIALFKASHEHKDQPDIIQIGLVLSDKDKIYFKASMLVDPSFIHKEWIIKPDTQAIHGISNKMVEQGGVAAQDMLSIFASLNMKADTIVCHNVDFDMKMLLVTIHRSGFAYEGLITSANKKPTYCTMKSSTNLLKLPGPYGYKWPKLKELYKFLFNETFEGAHDALNDVLAARRCYYELIERGKKEGGDKKAEV